MRLHQTWRNYLTQFLLERDIPIVSSRVRTWLVDLHADFFVEHSERDPAARAPHLRALFDTAIDVYLRALREGYPESEAREITHIQASWDFQNHGWGELIEFPPEEREAYYERYREFYDRYDATPENPFGTFAPPAGLPSAPETPERLDGDYPFAAPGLTDDIYVVDEATEIRLTCGDSVASGDATEGTASESTTGSTQAETS